MHDAPINGLDRVTVITHASRGDLCEVESWLYQGPEGVTLQWHQISHVPTGCFSEPY